MNILTIQTPQRTIRLQELRNGDVEVVGTPTLKNKKGEPVGSHLSQHKRDSYGYYEVEKEETLTVIPKEKRCEVAQFLVNG